MKQAPNISTTMEMQHIPRDTLEHLDIIVGMLLLLTQAVGIILTLRVSVHISEIGTGVEISNNIVARYVIRLGCISISG